MNSAYVVGEITQKGRELELVGGNTIGFQFSADQYLKLNLESDSASPFYDLTLTSFVSNGRNVEECPIVKEGSNSYIKLTAGVFAEDGEVSVSIVGIKGDAIVTSSLVSLIVERSNPLKAKNSPPTEFWQKQVQEHIDRWYNNTVLPDYTRLSNLADEHQKTATELIDKATVAVADTIVATNNANTATTNATKATADALAVTKRAETALSTQDNLNKTVAEVSVKHSQIMDFMQNTGSGELIQGLQGEIQNVKNYVGMDEIGVYGVEVDFPNRTYTRLGEAKNLNGGDDFDDIGPWKRRKCILADDGTVLAYRGEEGYTETGITTVELTVNGTTYPIKTNAQVMVEQPKFYYKVVPITLEPINDGEGYHMRKFKVYISSFPKQLFKVHPAFVRNGVEKDFIYLSTYQACPGSTSGGYDKTNPGKWYTGLGSGILSSIADALPLHAQLLDFTINAARAMAQRRGVGWELRDGLSMAMTTMLLLVEYATFDSQTVIGKGVVSGEQRSGTTAFLGDKSGSAEGTIGRVSATYRGEENLWGNNETWLDGFNIYVDESSNRRELYYADHDFISDIGTGPYKKFGVTLSEVHGWPSAIGYDGEMDALFIPTECMGADNWGLCDYYYGPTGKKVWRVTATNVTYSTHSGITALDCTDTSTYKQSDNAARIMYIPGTTAKEPTA